MVTSLTRYSSVPKLVQDLNSYLIGFNSYYDSMLTHASHSDFPKFNIVKNDKENYRLEMALAGYRKDQLKVYTEENRLVVEAEKQEDEKECYFHKGLTSKSFKWVRVLSDNLIVKDAKFENGLLIVNIERVVPEKHRRKDYL